jgi:hypothetical protein
MLFVSLYSFRNIFRSNKYLMTCAAGFHRNPRMSTFKSVRQYCAILIKSKYVAKIWCSSPLSDVVIIRCRFLSSCTQTERHGEANDRMFATLSCYRSEIYLSICPSVCMGDTVKFQLCHF